MLVVRCAMAFIALCLGGPSWGQAAAPPDSPEKTLTPETTDEPPKVTKTVAASKSGAAMKTIASSDADDRRLAQIRELVNKKAYAEAEPLALALAARQQIEQNANSDRLGRCRVAGPHLPGPAAAPGQRSCG